MNKQKSDGDFALGVLEAWMRGGGVIECERDCFKATSKTGEYLEMDESSDLRQLAFSLALYNAEVMSGK